MCQSCVLSADGHLLRCLQAFLVSSWLCVPWIPRYTASQRSLSLLAYSLRERRDRPVTLFRLPQDALAFGSRTAAEHQTASVNTKTLCQSYLKFSLKIQRHPSRPRTRGSITVYKMLTVHRAPCCVARVASPGSSRAAFPPARRRSTSLRRTNVRRGAVQEEGGAGVPYVWLQE